MKKIEKYIPLALEAADSFLAKDGKIPRECKGYISSFGAAVIQSGLLPAIVFNEKALDNERKEIMKSILYIINDRDASSFNSLFEYLLNKTTNYHNKLSIRIHKDKILNAATAMKLAIRTYDLT